MLMGLAAAVALHGALLLAPKRSVPPALPSVAPWTLLDVAVEPRSPEPPRAESAPRESRPPIAPLAPPSPNLLRTAPTAPASAATRGDSSPFPAPSGATNGDLRAEDDAAPLLATDLTDADWRMASGSGSTLGGRRAFGSVAGPRAVRSTSLEARDLSREATPPDLAPWVERNFPQIARMYRVEGVVTVSAMLDELGAPSDVRVEAVDPPGRGFGEACARTLLQGPKWRPKLNRDGRPVKTTVTYLCVFRLPADLEKSAAPPTESASQRIWTQSAE